jgi:DNA-binding transcriptional ArsR family regulator
VWTDDAAVRAVADGLWSRVRDVILAERRMERFAFAPDSPGAGPPGRLAALGADAGAIAALARDVTLRALAAAADPVNRDILSALGDRAVSVAEIARRVGLPPLALGERITALAQAGLAARDLERDAVLSTEAGRGLAALADALAEALAARLRREVPGLVAS